ncbi:hypothetical protein [Legionella sp.]|uniref:hypothetical protein n=1 Tax=Legionella sp. TaxID=459 RepID=UPI003CB496F2
MRKIIIALLVFVPTILLSGCYTTYPNNYYNAGYYPGSISYYSGWGGGWGNYHNGWYGHGGWGRAGWGRGGWGHGGWGHGGGFPGGGRHR